MAKLTFIKIVNDPIFQNELAKKFLALRTARLVPPAHCLRLRRTPLDFFIDEGKDNVKNFAEEYLLVVTKQSSLSFAQRVFIIQVCNPCAQKVIDFYEKQEQIFKNLKRK